MALCSCQFAWLTSGLPNEPYADLEEVIKGLHERGYNAIRVDAGLDFCFHSDGRPRGEVEFCQAVEGYSARMRVINCRGGGRHNVLKRVIRLMELAKAYNIYVILTSWEYMHTHWFIADRSLRAEIGGVPPISGS
jgi:nicotinamidase-related amidase